MTSFCDDIDGEFLDESSKFFDLHLELILGEIGGIKFWCGHTQVREEELLLEGTCLEGKMDDFGDFVNVALIN